MISDQMTSNRNGYYVGYIGGVCTLRDWFFTSRGDSCNSVNFLTLALDKMPQWSSCLFVKCHEIQNLRRRKWETIKSQCQRIGIFVITSSVTRELLRLSGFDKLQLSLWGTWKNTLAASHVVLLCHVSSTNWIFFWICLKFNDLSIISYLVRRFGLKLSLFAWRLVIKLVMITQK